MRHSLPARAVFLLLLAIVTFLTLTTDPDDTKTGFDLFDWLSGFLFGRPDLGDKFAHFVAYGALGFSGAAARWRLWGRASPVILLLAAYGVALEFVQHIGGVRDGNALDASANALGAAAGFAAFAGLMLALRKSAAA